MIIKITESFLYNDLELIFSAKDQEEQDYIAMYSDELPEGFEYTAVPVSQKSLEAFREWRMDLRDLMTERGEEEWYVMIVQGSYGEVNMQRQADPLTETGRLPEAGYHPRLAPDETTPALSSA